VDNGTACVTLLTGLRHYQFKYPNSTKPGEDQSLQETQGEPSSWLSLIERWSKELTDKRLRRDSFTRVQQLIDFIELWTQHWNNDPKPFIWHKTAQEIIAKVKRGRAALDQITNSATEH
jgi:hypothetical protein